MATFSEKGASTDKKYVAEQDMEMPNLLQPLQLFWSHSSVFALEKYLENLSFQRFLPEALTATFDETGVPTYKWYIAEQGVVISNLLKTFQSSWLHSSVFALEN